MGKHSSLLIYLGIHVMRFRETYLYEKKSLGDARDAMRRMSPAARNTLPRSIEPFTVPTAIGGRW